LLNLLQPSCFLLHDQQAQLFPHDRHTSSGVNFDAFFVGDALFRAVRPSSSALRFKLGLGVVEVVVSVLASVVLGDMGVTVLVSAGSVIPSGENQAI
jgi:hypothetical protein